MGSGKAGREMEKGEREEGEIELDGRAGSGDVFLLAI